jgi:hypothetical protein
LVSHHAGDHNYCYKVVPEIEVRETQESAASCVSHEARLNHANEIGHALELRVALALPRYLRRS